MGDKLDAVGWRITRRPMSRDPLQLTRQAADGCCGRLTGGSCPLGDVDAVKLRFTYALQYYGLGRISSAGQNPWQCMYIIAGAATLIWGFALWWVFPDSAQGAGAFGDEERKMLLERVRANNARAENKHSKAHQLREALPDYQLWFYIHRLFSRKCRRPAVVRRVSARCKATRHHQDIRPLTLIVGKYAPRYDSSFIGIMVCFAICVVLALGLRSSLARENAKREAENGPPEIVHGLEDMTDGENKHSGTICSKKCAHEQEQDGMAVAVAWVE
ncbi:Uncharacterized protein TPAR_03215 [Tolypocladium paradoxum]|uniref:Uncharacterized protein n=1 Tax=Tolypocladium paradoxum TaxID=94208 RepID=A0A2S4L291_9HYPO|nr:Uncharacterized protein TPAR_03215 [Tolypocladium paradoxum]